jgi:predicted small integral membrane protein
LRVILFDVAPTWSDEVVGLIPRVIDYMLILLVPLTVMVCIYTGVQMIIHRGIPAELMKYKDNLKRIGIGVALMLLAWTIIATLLKTLVNPSMSGFILLDLL